MQPMKRMSLNPYECSAYWWINIIKSKVREIFTTGARNEQEVQFANIFLEYTERDWRNLYLALIPYIVKDVESYTPKYPKDRFSQDTDIHSHDRLNEELTKIIGRMIPDIRLASNNVKDSVIYTTSFSASTWYKSCGEMKLPTEYEPRYVLTGDEKSLDFYYLLVATLSVIKKRNPRFNSIPLLRERICHEYIRLSEGKESLEKIAELFCHCFNCANDKGIVTGRSYHKTYFVHFRNVDYVGLEPYMQLAEHYANVVLEKEKDIASLKKTVVTPDTK